MQVDFLQEGNPIVNLWARVIDVAFENLEILRPSARAIHYKHQLQDRDNAINFFSSTQSNLEWICEQMDWPVSVFKKHAQEIIAGKRRYESFNFVMAGINRRTKEIEEAA